MCAVTTLREESIDLYILILFLANIDQVKRAMVWKRPPHHTPQLFFLYQIKHRSRQNLTNDSSNRVPHNPDRAYENQIEAGYCLNRLRRRLETGLPEETCW